MRRGGGAVVFSQGIIDQALKAGVMVEYNGKVFLNGTEVLTTDGIALNTHAKLHDSLYMWQEIKYCEPKYRQLEYGKRRKK
jgi:hypothetical protein